MDIAGLDGWTEAGRNTWTGRLDNPSTFTRPDQRKYRMAMDTAHRWTKSHSVHRPARSLVPQWIHWTEYLPPTGADGKPVHPSGMAANCPPLPPEASSNEAVMYMDECITVSNNPDFAGPTPAAAAVAVHRAAAGIAVRRYQPVIKRHAAASPAALLHFMGYTIPCEYANTLQLSARYGYTSVT